MFSPPVQAAGPPHEPVARGPDVPRPELHLPIKQQKRLLQAKPVLLAEVITLLGPGACPGECDSRHTIADWLEREAARDACFSRQGALIPCMESVTRPSRGSPAGPRGPPRLVVCAIPVARVHPQNLAGLAPLLQYLQTRKAGCRFDGLTTCNQRQRLATRSGADPGNFVYLQQTAPGILSLPATHTTVL